MAQTFLFPFWVFAIVCEAMITVGVNVIICLLLSSSRFEHNQLDLPNSAAPGQTDSLPGG